MAKATPRKRVAKRKTRSQQGSASAGSRKAKPKRAATAPEAILPVAADLLDDWRPKKRAHEILRWTIDRLDKQAGVLRLEQVCMKAAKAARMAVADLADARMSEFDQLSWWDTRTAKLVFMTPAQLRAALRLKPDAALAENMVFWVLLRRERGTAPEVFHATRAARQLAKRLYQSVTDVHPG